MFTNVLPVIRGLKQGLAHAAEMKPETAGKIAQALRSHNPLFAGGSSVKAERALKILRHDLEMPADDAETEVAEGAGATRQKGAGKKAADGASKQAQVVPRRRGAAKVDFAEDRVCLKAQADIAASTSLMARMRNIEDQFLANPALHEQAAVFRKQQQQQKQREDSDDEAEGKGDFDHFDNKRLLTPRTQKLMNKKDASELLQDEIQASVLRLKQAKFGHSLNEIAPGHEQKFYLPDKSRYVRKEQ